MARRRLVESVDAETAVIDVYDPNTTAEAYSDESRQLKIDVSKPSAQPIINNDEIGYKYLYQRFTLVGPSQPEFRGAFTFTTAMARDFLILPVGTIDTFGPSSCPGLKLSTLLAGSIATISEDLSISLPTHQSTLRLLHLMALNYRIRMSQLMERLP